MPNNDLQIHQQYEQRATIIRDRWKSVRLSDAIPILKDLWNGRNTEVGGEAARAIEDSFRSLTGCKHALAMNSGTSTLHSAYFAVGVRPGDEVILPSYTFFATATPLLQLGAKPVLCEIDPKTLTADPRDVESRITSRTRAICVVHVWGNPARLDEFARISERHGIPLIEDCSHAHGATFQGRSVGSFGAIGCFSMQGGKAVSGGEAGIAVTNSALYFDRMLALGHNGRVSNSQAADTFDLGPLSYGVKYRPHLFAMRLALSSFKRLRTLNQLRERNLKELSLMLTETGVLTPIESYPESKRGGFLEFIFRYQPQKCNGWTREAFVKAVAAEGVPIGVDRYSAFGANFRYLHESKIFKVLDDEGIGGPAPLSLGAAQNLPVTETACDELVTMPAFAKVSKGDLKKIAIAVMKIKNYANKNPDLRCASLRANNI
jgi:perosamine synthetase